VHRRICAIVFGAATAVREVACSHGFRFIVIGSAWIYLSAPDDARPPLDLDVWVELGPLEAGRLP
jgi:hypothetical protein